MVKLTKAQQQALLKLYNRTPIFLTTEDSNANKPLSYRQFRKTVSPGFLGQYIMVPWAGMIIGIERDGYTHS